MVADGDGNLLIADAHNNVVRTVAPDGSIATLAGTGTAGPAGSGRARDAQLPSLMIEVDAGNVYIADRFNFRSADDTAG